MFNGFSKKIHESPATSVNELFFILIGRGFLTSLPTKDDFLSGFGDFVKVIWDTM
jgi:hypothetical protein